MLQYQQALMAQKVFFDPTKPFQRRLFNGGEKMQMQQPAYAIKKPTAPDDIHLDEADGLIQHSVKRIKKKLNDFILNNFSNLFQQDGPDNASAISKDMIASHQKLIKKAGEELRLSTEWKKSPKELLMECI